MTQIRVVGWLRNQVQIARSGGDVVRLDLSHLPLGAKVGHEVQTFDVPGNKPPDSWYEETAAQIISSAECDAGALGGVQTYVVRVYREKEPDKCTGRLIHRVRCEDDSDNVETDGYNSEPPTQKGLIAAYMRRDEAKDRILVQSMSSMMVTMQRTLARLGEQNEKLQTQRLDTLEQLEEMLSAKLDRELSAKREENHQALMSDLVKEVKMLAPAVIGKLTGSTIPGAVDPKDIALKRFVESLKPEQMNALAKELSTEQQIALMELVSSLQGIN